MHAWSLLRKDSTAFCITSNGKLSQMTCSAVFNSEIFLGLGLYLSYLSSIIPHTQKSSGFKSGEFGGHSALSMRSRHSGRLMTLLFAARLSVVDFKFEYIFLNGCIF